MTITLDQLLRMKGPELFEIVKQGNPLDTDALADSTYTGIDLSMPDLFHKLMWKSFRKTFHRDPRSGALRGWNVKVKQTGSDTPIRRCQASASRPCSGTWCATPATACSSPTRSRGTPRSTTRSSPRRSSWRASRAAAPRTW